MKFKTLTMSILSIVSLAASQLVPPSFPPPTDWPSRTNSYTTSSPSLTTLSRTVKNALEAQHAMTSTIEIPAPVTPTACFSGSTISTHVNFEQNCNWMSRTAGEDVACTVTLSTDLGCRTTAASTMMTTTQCPPGTCGPGCRSADWCHRKEAMRAAAYTSLDFGGGRSQRWVAMEASSTPAHTTFTPVSALTSTSVPSSCSSMPWRFPPGACGPACGSSDDCHKKEMEAVPSTLVTLRG